jgi:hypothetical protein
MKHPIHTVKVTLRDIRPPIWRRLEIPADMSLSALHRVLQAAMGWSDCHLHQFVHNGTYYGVPDREFGMRLVSERRTRLGDLLHRPQDRLSYEYDFGDNWTHELLLESITDAAAGVRYPRVVAGKRACPPEDVGGFPGYASFLDAIRDPAHEEHSTMIEWVGGDFDPEEFDLAAANGRLMKASHAMRSR